MFIIYKHHYEIIISISTLLNKVKLSWNVLVICSIFSFSRIRHISNICNFLQGSKHFLTLEITDLNSIVRNLFTVGLTSPPLRKEL